MAIGGRDAAPGDVCFNDGPGYGRFDRIEPGRVRGYRMEIDRQVFIETFAGAYWQLLCQARTDDARTGGTSEFRRTGYVPLNAAFAYPQLLAGILRAYLVRDHVLAACLGPFRPGQFVINSVDTVSASGPVVISGRGWQ